MPSPKRRGLWITHVWPESYSSAGGTRVESLARGLRDRGWDWTFASAGRNEEARDRWAAHGWKNQAIELNHSSFDEWVKALAPEVVIFDRFLCMEQFGWRVAEAAPDALRVLDTIDLHFLRRGREEAVKAGYFSDDIESFDPALIDLVREEWARELATLARADLVWMVSDFETELLKVRYGLPADQVATLPIGMALNSRSDLRPEGSRSGVAWIGNFRHAPNRDALEWFLAKVWPTVRAAQPDAFLRVAGAYPPKECMAWSSRERGVEMVGPVPDAVDFLSTALVSAAPIRFGAGIKGKILDSWAAGTAVVTTPIGAEGMSGPEGFPGWVAGDAPSFARAVVHALQGHDERQKRVARGFDALLKTFEFEKVADSAHAMLLHALESREQWRSTRWLSKLLESEALRSSKYFSKWIELKNQAGAKS